MNKKHFLILSLLVSSCLPYNASALSPAHIKIFLTAFSAGVLSRPEIEEFIAGLPATSHQLHENLQAAKTSCSEALKKILEELKAASDDKHEIEESAINAALYGSLPEEVGTGNETPATLNQTATDEKRAEEASALLTKKLEQDPEFEAAFKKLNDQINEQAANQTSN